MSTIFSGDIIDGLVKDVRMPDEQKIHFAVIGLLCALPAIATIAAVLHAAARPRRANKGGRGFNVIQPPRQPE